MKALESTLARFLPRSVASSAPAVDAPPTPVVIHPRREAAPAAVQDDCELDADVPRSRKLVELFLRLAPEQVNALCTAADNGDATTLRATSHKLKGSCASLGARALAVECEIIQNAAEKSDLGDAAGHVRRVRSLFETTTRLLEQELVQLQNRSS